MTAAAIVELASPTRKSPGRPWHIMADRSLCLGQPGAKHMSGGSCTASLISALQAETSRPLIQASVQFHRAPRLDSEATIETEIVRTGRSVVLARATLLMDGEPSASLQATMGRTTNVGSRAWAKAKARLDPRQCERIPFIREDEDDLHAQLDMRLASSSDDHAEGCMRFWVNTYGLSPNQSCAFAAIVADYIPEAIHLCLGNPVGAVSLDNSFRNLGQASSDWWLCETRLLGVDGGLFHGTMTIITEAGAPIAHASQSGLVRPIN